MTVSTIFEKLKLKFNLNLEGSWLKLLNDQLKWSVAFFIRISFIVLTILFVLFLIKFSGIVKELQSIAGDRQGLGIEPKDSTIKSSPDINYDKELNNMADIIKMLKGKKKEKEDMKNEKDKNTADTKTTK